MINAIENWCIEHMTARRWITTQAVSILVLGGGGFWWGWIAGEQHIGHQIQDAVNTFSDSLSHSLSHSLSQDTRETKPTKATVSRPDAFRRAEGGTRGDETHASTGSYRSQTHSTGVCI